MDIRPKRRKFKDNPYILESIKENNLFYINFKNHSGYHKIMVTEEVFKIFDESEKYENAMFKEYSVHIEHSEQTDINLSIKNVLIRKSVEEEAIDNLLILELKEYINELPSIQKKRLIEYFINNKTLKEIAKKDNCSINAIKLSIDIALSSLAGRIKK